ncbi:MAG: DUF1460 domain-containing protein [Elusimicrobia bacterium]|nr:DUF1460 domain-containing protein [Elusimicrobiota bacterium]
MFEMERETRMKAVKAGQAGKAVKAQSHKKFLFVIALTAFTAFTALTASPAFKIPSEQEISDMIELLRKEAPKNVAHRIEVISARFIGMRYVLGPLGEEVRGEFDRDPLIRFDAADCTTFIETVMALALARNKREVVPMLTKIRYKDGVISYQTRNHFVSVDWVPNNKQAGLIEDITEEFAGDGVRWAEKVISKRQWYLVKTEEILDKENVNGFGKKLSPRKRQALVAKWQALGKDIPDEPARLAYAPVALLKEKAKKIPSGAVFNLVRVQDYPVVIVSHQGLIIQKAGQTVVRHASSVNGVVEDMPLEEYLAKYETSKYPALGMNINVVQEVQEAKKVQSTGR